MFNPSYQVYRRRHGGRLNQGGSKTIGQCLYCDSMRIKDLGKFLEYAPERVGGGRNMRKK